MENLDNPFKKTGKNGYIFNTKNQLLRWDFQISRENRIKIAALALEKEDLIELSKNILENETSLRN